MNTRSTVFLIAAGAAVFLFLALSIEFFYAANYFGFVGRTVTAVLRQYFGLFSLVLPFVIVLAAARYKKSGGKQGLMTLAVGVLTVIFVGAAAAFVFPDRIQTGRLSPKLFGYLKGPFGPAGAAIFLITVTVILVTVLFGVSVKDVSKRFKK